MTNLTPLLEKLRSDSPILQRVAISELSMLRDPFAVEPLTAVMRRASRGVQVEAARALVKFGEPAVAPLIQFFREDNRDLWTLASAALLMMGQGAVSGLVEAARNDVEQVQVLAIGVLGQIGDARPVDFLIESVQSQQGALQTAAAVALVRIGQPAVRPVLGLMMNFTHLNLRATAIEILKQIGDDAVDTLIEALYESGDLERTQAAYVLGELGEVAIPHLLEGLQHENKTVRYVCASALGQIATPVAVPALITLLHDTELVPSMGKMVCDAAYNALKNIKTNEAQFAVATWVK